MKSLILYRSQYGSTEQYAHWIQEALSSQADHFDNLEKYDIQDYDLIIVGEGVYAGQLKTPKQLIPIIEKYPDKKFIFFMVGIADMEEQENREKLYNDLAKAMGPVIEKTKVFSARSARLQQAKFQAQNHDVDVGKLSKRKPEKDLPKDADQLISTYGKKVSFIDKNSIEPLIKYANEEHFE